MACDIPDPATCEAPHLQSGNLCWFFDQRAGLWWPAFFDGFAHKKIDGVAQRGALVAPFSVHVDLESDRFFFPGARHILDWNNPYHDAIKAAGMRHECGDVFVVAVSVADAFLSGTDIESLQGMLRVSDLVSYHCHQEDDEEYGEICEEDDCAIVEPPTPVQSPNTLGELAAFTLVTEHGTRHVAQLDPELVRVFDSIRNAPQKKFFAAVKSALYAASAGGRADLAATREHELYYRGTADDRATLIKLQSTLGGPFSDDQQSHIECMIMQRAISEDPRYVSLVVIPFVHTRVVQEMTGCDAATAYSYAHTTVITMEEHVSAHSAMMADPSTENRGEVGHINI